MGFEQTSRLRRKAVLAATVLAIGVLSVLVVSAVPDTIIPGDPAEYRLRVRAMLDNGLPYFDVPFEHLPVMVAPMMAAWFMGGWVSQTAYVFAFAGLMVATMSMIALGIDALGERLGVGETGIRWVVVTLPLMPLVVFRNDPLAVLLFVYAALLWVGRQRAFVGLAVVGAMAKIWPAALALAAWRRSERFAAVGVAAAGVAAVTLTVLPGFSTARKGLGIHAETVVGGVVGLWRTLDASASGVQVTTAAYLPVGVGFVVANSLIGIGMLAFAVRSLMRSTGDRAAVLAVGSAVTGVVLASQLFSLQYVLWLTPFVALAQRRRVYAVAIAVGAISTAVAWIWDPLLFEEPWFYGILSLRSAGVILIGWLLGVEARASSRGSFLPETG